MDENAAIHKALGINVEEIFEKTTYVEFYGYHLFPPLEEKYYQFPQEQTGESAWLLSLRSEDSPYQVYKADASQRMPPNPSLVELCTFGSLARIHVDWIHDKRTDLIKQQVDDGAKSLAQKANKAYTDILMHAASRKIVVKNNSLDEALADIFAISVNEGFRPDRFVFPEYLEAKLVQQGIILRDNEIHHSHYVGKTITGQRAFTSRDLPKNTGIIFSSDVTITLGRESQFYVTKEQAFWRMVCGVLSINPIIKNTQAVFLVGGIEESLANKQSKPAMPKPITQYVDLNRIEELRAISSPDFDFTKLIKLCEELNLCYTNECYLAVVMLVRTLLDHIPPVFGFKTFAEVASQYGGSESNKSLKKNLKHLQDSLRNIADAHLHSKIRSSETLPNSTQVNFSNDLDVLLAEIVRRLRE